MSGLTDVRHSRDPEVGALLGTLNDLDVRYILVGSVAAAVYGAETGEKKWVARPTMEQELSDWAPDIANLETLDHLYVTRYGNFDVVPALAGAYDVLERRASQNTCEGLEVRVAHIDDLLARLTVPRREKDVPRVSQLREIQQRLGQRPE